MLLDTRLKVVLALVAASGLIASLIAYAATFSNQDAGAAFKIWLFLLLGVAAVLGPMPRRGTSAQGRAWLNLRCLSEMMPRWSLPFACVVLVFAALQTLWALSQNDAGIATEKDGHYTLCNRGRIVRELTEAEYINLRKWDARAFASTAIALYYIPFVYWTFGRERRQEQ